MRSLLAALMLCALAWLAPAAAQPLGQCNYPMQPGQACGNSNAARQYPAASSIDALMARKFGSTAGHVLIGNGTACLAGSVTPCFTAAALGASSGVQAYSAILAAFAGLSPAADKCAYFTGSAAVALTDCPSFGRSLMNAATAAAARTTLGLDPLAIGTTGDAIVTIAATVRAQLSTATFTAARAWTLPAASAVNAGSTLVVSDAGGGINGTNYIVLTRAGSDTINGAATANMTAQYQQIALVSDGVSKWTFNPAGVGAGSGTVTAVTAGAGLTGGTITTSGTVALANASTSVRQALLSSAVSAAGDPAFASAGAGLNVNLTATATPLYMTFAAGYNTTTGPTDYVGALSADATSYWATLPASQYSFLAVDRDSGSGALSASQTLMRPQRGPVFYKPRQALLHFENNLTDDWGNAWASNGASFSSGTVKFGTYSLRLNGSSSYAQSADILNPGIGNWTMNVWANLDSNVSASVMSVGQGFGIFVATNASGKPLLYLSSGGSGSGWDIVSAGPGATTVTSAAWHHWELTFDGSAYRLFLDGTLQVTVTSSAIVWPEGSAMAVGAQVGIPSTTAGYFDEFDFVPYARHVAAFTPPVAAYAISGDWFDTNAMVMKTASGAGPTWTTIQRLYVAEVATGAASVSAVYNYSSHTQYRGADFAFNTGNNRVKVGNRVSYAATPQFITESGSIDYVTTYVLPPSTVPPDATWFYVQTTIFHAPIQDSAGVANQDCSFNARLPVGLVQNAGAFGTAYSNFTGMGTAVNTTSFTEYAGIVLRFPVINGIAAFEGIISGPTCNIGGANKAKLWAVVLGYDLP